MTVEEQRNNLKQEVIEREQLYATLQKKLVDEARTELRKKMEEEVEHAYQQWQKALEAYNTFHAKTIEQGWTEEKSI